MYIVCNDVQYKQYKQLENTMYAKFKSNTKTYKLDLDTLQEVCITEAATGDDGSVEYGVVVATSKGVYAADFAELDDAYESVLEFSEQGMNINLILLGEAADDTAFEEDALAHIDEGYSEEYFDDDADDAFITETFHDLDQD